MFLPLKKILPAKIGQWDLNDYFLQRELRRAWRVVLATQSSSLAKATKPLYFKNGIFFIGCTDSCQANEWRFQEIQLRQALNRVLRKPLVNQIKFLSY